MCWEYTLPTLTDLSFLSSSSVAPFSLEQWPPHLFGTKDQFHERQFFHGPGQGGGAVRIIQAYYIIASRGVRHT